MEFEQAFIDYKNVLTKTAPNDREALIRVLLEALPHEWADAYKKLSPHQANIMRVTHGGFEYLFDHSSELVAQGVIAEGGAVEDRIVAVHGLSQIVSDKRRDSLMRKHPLGPVDFIRAHSTDHSSSRYDKGHFIGHTLGGMLHMNLFPQSKEINRGWSENGKVYRRMENYCQTHPDTYCFSRPIYSGLSGHPQVIEFGVLKSDGSLWVTDFQNCDDSEEMAQIERLFRAKIAGADREHLRSII